MFAPIPRQELHHSPSCSPELLDLLQPSAEQQERVSEFLEELMSDACDVTVNVAPPGPDCSHGAHG
jgi:hypothetical protein